MTQILTFNHRITDEPVAMVRLLEDEGAEIHLIRCETEGRLDTVTPCDRQAEDRVVQLLTRSTAPRDWRSG